MRPSGAVATGGGPSCGYVVDDLVIDIGQQRVWRSGIELQLPQLSFDFLIALVRAAPDVVSFDALIDRVWSGSVVSPETVTQRVKLVREALGDDSHTPRYIGAVRGRGYRLLSAAVPLERMPPTLPLDGSSSAGSAANGRRWRVIALAAIFIIAAGGLIAYVQARKTGEIAAAPATAAQPNTIAVLPFVNMSGDPDNEYFSDGLSEELLNRLTLMPELQVAARTSSFHFKDKAQDVKEIGRLLGVRHVLEGSVRRQGNRVRVTAQLVSTKDGYRLWSNAFERHVADVLAIQDEIALAVAENLKLTLIPTAGIAARRPMTIVPEAFDLYLRGRHLYQSWQLDRIERGMEYLEHAIRLDPGFAPVHVALAEALFARAQNTLECCNPTDPWNVRRRDLLSRAIELDPRNADAIASVGLDLMMARDFEGAGRELRRAEALNPNGELVLRYLNYYYQSVGWPPERGIDYARHLFRLDPLNSAAAWGLAAAHWHAHQYEQALSAADSAIELDPNSWFAHWLREAALLDLGRYEEAIAATQRTIELSAGMTDAYADLVIAYAAAGKPEEARKIFDRIDAPSHKPRWRHTFRAQALAGLGALEEAVTALEEAYRANDGFLHEALHYKVFIPLHSHPRFQEIVRLLKQERRVRHARDMNINRRAIAAAQ